MYMKKIFVVPTLALLAFISVPTQSQALSCIDPEGMVEYIVKDPNSIVVTAKATETKELVDKKADEQDPNQMYNTGYTGQMIDISKAHMGTVPDAQWVYFRRDGTWNYLCTGEPPKVGTENIYVLQMPSNSFQLETVTAVYPVDSQIAKDLLKAIDKADSEAEPMIYEVSKADWLTRLHDELMEMAFIIKVKLAEWNWYKSAS